MSEAKAEFLAKILLIQNLIGQLPDEKSIFAFTCRGLLDLPGVGTARVLVEGDEAEPDDPTSKRESIDRHFPIIMGGAKYGEILVQLREVNAFAPYAPFVGNICFMISLILEERWQKRIIKRHQDELEQRVEERTKALEDEKELLAVTLRSIGDGVITTDIQGRVTHLNKIAEHLTGWSQTEALGKPLPEIFPLFNSETRKACVDPAQKVITSGLNIELENHTVLVARDGTERPIADSAAPIKNRNSNSVGVVIVFRDMTEKHKVQDSLQRKDRLDSLGVLAGGIAHDFNNLLAGLFGYVDLARERASDREQIDALDSALGAFERAKNLTQQLLTFAKGGIPVKRTAALGPILRDSTTFALSGSAVTHSCEIADDLKLCDFDPNQLAQVIDNIVINAKQAMGGTGHVKVTARNERFAALQHALLPEGNYLCITLTDTGPGIPEDKLPHIFDPFFTTKTTGSGLGLATCHSIIHKHDGIIEANSVLGQGTCFRIYLPASLKKSVDPQQEMMRRHRGSGVILIMDDEKSLQDVMARMVKLMGYSCVIAKDGETALELWSAQQNHQKTPIIAAFLDLTIRGGMGGQEAAKKLRALGAQCPIFAVSGYSGDPIMARPREFDFDASLIKPFTVMEFSNFMDQNMPGKS